MQCCNGSTRRKLYFYLMKQETVGLFKNALGKQTSTPIIDEINEKITNLRKIYNTRISMKKNQKMQYQYLNMFCKIFVTICRMILLVQFLRNLQT